MSELSRPQVSRRQHQEMLSRQRRLRRKRRMARMRRLRVLKTVRSIRFWTRFSGFVAGFVCVAFWAKFAFVYDIPAYVQVGPLARVNAYVTVKPWWFGPPVFDLGSYDKSADQILGGRPYSMLMNRLGKYAAVVETPQFVWIDKR